MSLELQSLIVTYIDGSGLTGYDVTPCYVVVVAGDLLRKPQLPCLLSRGDLFRIIDWNCDGTIILPHATETSRLHMYDFAEASHDVSLRPAQLIST